MDGVDGINGWVARKKGKLWFLKTYDPSTHVPSSLPSLLSVSMTQVAVSVTNNRISTQRFPCGYYFWFPCSRGGQSIKQQREAFSLSRKEWVTSVWAVVEVGVCLV